MKVKVSENIVLYWKEGKLVCDDFVAHQQYALSRQAEPLLRWFAEWKDIESLSELESDKQQNGTFEGLASQLLNAGVLIAEDSEEHRLEDKLDAWDTWRRSSRYFHCSSRTLENTDFLLLEEDGNRLREKAQHNPAPPLYKEYPAAERIALGQPRSDGIGDPDHDSFIEVLLRRRTSRSFDQDRPVSLDHLSAILHYVAGATHVGHSAGTGDVLLKTSPSGGARHPIEVYPCVLNVEGLKAGVYHYSVEHHALEVLTEADKLRDQIPRMCGDQDWTDQAAVVFFYAAVIDRPRWKYQSPRIYRAMCMDLGHLSQTFYLVSAWLGLGAFFIGALREESVENELGLDWTEEIVLGANGVGVANSQARAEGALRPHPRP